MELTVLLERLATVLEYPDEGGPERLEAFAGQAEGWEPSLAGELRRGIAGATPERLQELYASTFDLNPAACLYAGYHLFGDSYKRGALMAKLNAEYGARGFTAGAELPDHVGVLLRFLAGPAEEELRIRLLEELVLPALERIASSFEGTVNVYGSLMRAALEGLKREGVLEARPFTHSLPVLAPDGSLSRG